MEPIAKMISPAFKDEKSQLIEAGTTVWISAGGSFDREGIEGQAARDGWKKYTVNFPMPSALLFANTIDPTIRDDLVSMGYIS